RIMTARSISPKRRVQLRSCSTSSTAITMAPSADRDRQSASPLRNEGKALATLAALAQISTPSAAHFLKSHQLLVQKFAADRDRQSASPLRNEAASPLRNEGATARFSAPNRAVAITSDLVRIVNENMKG